MLVYYTYIINISEEDEEVGPWADYTSVRRWTIPQKGSLQGLERFSYLTY